MKLESVDAALEEFLTSAQPLAVALSGGWGRGKTHYWQAYLKAWYSRSDPRYYSYVSLFGVQSLEALRDAIFGNAVPLAHLPESGGSASGPGREEIADRLKHMAFAARRHASKLAPQLPKIESFAPVLRTLAFGTVRNYVICLDDLERHSELLPIKDILGLVAQLRDQQCCRVLLILNSDTLGEDSAEFQRLKEKVFDFEIVFDPDPEDCAQIAFPNESDYHGAARAHAIKLGIRNMRVLFRIRRALDTLLRIAEQEHVEDAGQMIHSAVLLGWCFNSSDELPPPYEYVKHLTFGNFVDMPPMKTLTEEKKEYNERLSAYGYARTDELDQTICEALERGYVNPGPVRSVLKTRRKEQAETALKVAFDEAWALYRSGFGEDTNELVERLTSSMRQGALYINIANASATTSLLRMLGLEEIASQLTKHWIAQHVEHSPQALDLSANFLSGEITDPVFKAAVQEAFGQLPASIVSFEDAAVEFARENAWDDNALRVLASAPEEDFYRMFKDPDREVRILARKCLNLAKTAHLDESHGPIAAKATMALIRIGRESPLNRLRVKALGVDPDASRLDEADSTDDHR